jgi:hypothetical protein
MTGIAGTVWSTDVSSYTSPSAGYDLANASSGSGLTAGDVWDFSIIGFGGTNSAAVYLTDTNFTVANIETYVQNQTPQDVWTYAGIEGRTITGGLADTVTTLTNPANVTTGSMTGIAGTVWSVGSRTITGGTATTVTNPVTFESAQYAAIASSVWNAATRTLTSAGAGLTAGDVWTYASREITGGTADTVVNPVNVSTGSMTGIAYSTWSNNSMSYDTNNSPMGLLATTGNYTAYTYDVIQGIGATIWEYDISAISTAGTAGSQLNLAASSSGSGISAGDVWTYATRTITGGIADTVTTLTNRSGFAITGGTITTVSDKTGYSLSGTQAFNLTGNITGNLSGSVGSVSGAVGSVTGNVGGNVVGSVASVTNPVTFVNTQYAAIASSVWNAGTRTLTSGGSGISAYDVWNFDPTAMTVPQAGAILTDIQTDTNQIQTDISNIPNNVWASDVSGYSTPGEAGFELSQAAAGAGLTVGDVWNAPSRTITGGIANTVSTVTNGVIVTTNNDKTGYSLSGTQSFNLTGNITGNLSGSVASVTNPVTFNSAQYAGIASSVWNAATRTLTSGSGISAGDVWTYGTRSLTSGAGITVNAATNIINGPYFVKSNVDGQDGNLDVIRGMVQDIQLTVTDAFQNPFDVTALGLAVNFYDQAGTLVTSYGTSSLYAPAGLIQFTLDTAVTGNEGRYNLILSAAGAGNTIKFGPLTTLVRPF